MLAGANGAWADEAVATASATPAPAADTSTAAQIDQFIKSAPTPTLEQDGVDGSPRASARCTARSVSASVRAAIAAFRR
uniref:Uncharacterized protein n=1 Tax=Phenylobacterium glaciei TaxID=2803784 RepID=A0A974P0R4_9CAUL|nr:hypothetical protein JKL49_17640 [Phenylobacterium glaciei]